jgi:hypothetical protein
MLPLVRHRLAGDLSDAPASAAATNSTVLAWPGSGVRPAKGGTRADPGSRVAVPAPRSEGGIHATPAPVARRAGAATTPTRAAICYRRSSLNAAVFEEPRLRANSCKSQPRLKVACCCRAQAGCRSSTGQPDRPRCSDRHVCASGHPRTECWVWRRPRGKCGIFGHHSLGVLMASHAAEHSGATGVRVSDVSLPPSQSSRATRRPVIVLGWMRIQCVLGPDAQGGVPVHAAARARCHRRPRVRRH